MLGLAGLNAAVTLCWVVYNLFLGKLLLQVGLDVWWATAARPERAGLGVGLLLGGGGAALAAFNVALAVRRPTPQGALVASALFYLLTLGLLLGPWRRPAQP